VNDATSTPDDPDRTDGTDRTDRDDRSAVATGEQAAVPATTAEHNDAGGAASAAEPVVEDDPEAPATPAPEQSAANGSTPTLDKPAATGAVAAEEPTARMPRPTPANGSRPALSDDEVTRRVHPIGLPPQGPVPTPGPAAAAPPPWQRIPGREAQVPAQQPGPQPAANRLAGGLLEDEIPTAFLETPARSGEAGGQGDEPAEAGGSWGSVRAVRNRPPRQAALQLKRLDPWSALKLALVLAVVLFLIWMVAVGVLYGVLGGLGVWDRLNGTYADLVSGAAPTGGPLISAGRVFGVAALVGAINSLLFAVAVTLGAFIYNVSADLVGGIEVTLSERD
jgi:hypothetical protein